MDRYTYLQDVPKATYFIVFVLGMWGSLLSFIKRNSDGVKRSIKQKMFMFVTDLISTMGLSVITFCGAIGLGLNELLAVGISGFVAHQGTRAIYLIELIIADKLGSNSLKEEIKKGK
jgi:hypothetical protein